MGTTIGGKDIATMGSGHVVVSTPAVSLNPPPPGRRGGGVNRRPRIRS